MSLAGKNNEVARRYVDAVNAKPVDQLDEFIDSNYNNHMGASSREEAKEAAGKIVADPTFDYKTTIVETIAEGDCVVVRLASTLRGKTNDAAIFYRLKNGKIVDDRATANNWK
jgi:predicted SnoaL-like aldol condensation-catalyzing enzyme